MQTALDKYMEDEKGFNAFMEQETRTEAEERRGSHFFLPLFGKASIELHLVSCQILSSTDGHQVNWISH